MWIISVGQAGTETTPPPPTSQFVNEFNRSHWLPRWSSPGQKIWTTDWFCSFLLYKMIQCREKSWMNRENTPSQGCIRCFCNWNLISLSTRKVEFTESRYLQNMHRYGFPNNLIRTQGIYQKRVLGTYPDSGYSTFLVVPVQIKLNSD